MAETPVSAHYRANSTNMDSLQPTKLANSHQEISDVAKGVFGQVIMDNAIFAPVEAGVDSWELAAAHAVNRTLILRAVYYR